MFLLRGTGDPITRDHHYTIYPPTRDWTRVNGAPGEHVTNWTTGEDMYSVAHASNEKDASTHVSSEEETCYLCVQWEKCLFYPNN